MLTKSPRIQWQKHTGTTEFFDGMIGRYLCYYVTEQQKIWYWVDNRRGGKSRPYIDREDAMRGAQRHHEERENG